MIERDRGRIHEFGRGTATALRVHDLALEEAGIPQGGKTGRARGKTYVYGEYMDILNEGTEV